MRWNETAARCRARSNAPLTVYITPDPNDPEAVSRRGTVERFMRKQAGQLATSHVVLLEARNVFSRTTGEKHPREWADLEADFDGRLWVLDCLLTRT